MTYGAQPNTKLLQDYGFTTLPNIEPDGSSNDVVVLELPTDGDRPEALPAAPDVQTTSVGRRWLAGRAARMQLHRLERGLHRLLVLAEAKVRGRQVGDGE